MSLNKGLRRNLFRESRPEKGEIAKIHHSPPMGTCEKLEARPFLIYECGRRKNINVCNDKKLLQG